MVLFVSELNLKSEESCRWRRRKQDRPAEILAAALKIFSKKGFAAAKLDEVAIEAGVSKGTLYLYFESKEALLKAVVMEFVVPHIAKAEEHADHYEGSIKELMLNLLEQWRVNILETELSGLPKIMIAEASNFPEIAKFYLENVIQRMRDFVTKLIDVGVERGEFRQCNSEYTARAFLTIMVFTAVWKYSFAPLDKNYDINEYLNSSMEIFLRGILKDNQE